MEERQQDPSNIHFYITVVSLAIVFVSVLMRIMYLPATVVGTSMDETLSDGNVLAYSLLVKEVRGIERADILAIKAEVNGERINMVKRAIGLPKDNIKILEGRVYINNNMIKEKYLNEGELTHGHIDVDLGEDEYFVMGDNRDKSMDSRDPRIGIINKKDILGVVLKKDLSFKNKNKDKSKSEKNKEAERLGTTEVILPEGFFRDIEIIER